jgi:hypothetical protein
MKIDFAFPFIQFKNGSGSEIGFEIKNIFNLNSNAEKLNEKSYLISRLYTAIFIYEKDIYEDLSELITDLIL